MRSSRAMPNQGRRSAAGLPRAQMPEGSTAGKSPCHRSQTAGTRRVCGWGSDPTLGCLLAKAKGKPWSRSGSQRSDFHSNRLAASLSVMDSRGSRHKIHVLLTPTYCLSEMDSLARIILAPYSCAIRSVASFDP